MHKFSGGAAHRVALEHGYVDENTGEEVRVKTADEMAYKLKTENGELKVDEIKAGGGLIEEHGKGSPFEKNTEEYEYRGHATEETTPHQDNAQVVAAREKVLAGMEKTNQHSLEGAENKDTSQSVLSETMTSKRGTGLLEEYRDIVKNHPEFAKYSNKITPAKLVELYETHKENTKYIFKNNPSNSWKNLQDLRVKDLLEETKLSKDPATNNLIWYLKQLREHTGMKRESPWINFWGSRMTVKQYIANGLQKLQASGKLEGFETNLRK